MNRLARRMAELGERGRKALVIYLTQGDPSPAATPELVRAAAEGGADCVELGVPFSDPNADGPVIQEAMQRARAAGGGLASSLAAVRELRESGCEVPLVLFGYYNPIFVAGLERFAADAAGAGVDAVLTVDVPMGELGELSAPLAGRGLGVVPLVAPTSTEDRIQRARELDPPFVYYISMTGVTGGAFQGAAGGAERIAEVRRLTGAPVCIGFGIRSGEDARRAAAQADGVVVGSAVVRRIAEAPGADEAARRVRDFVAELREALDAA